MSPNFILLHVENPAKSAAFYRTILARDPVETSPTFVMFALDGGFMLGLWDRATVQPAARSAGGMELGLPVGSIQAVEQAYTDWQDHQIPIAQTPTRMDFGYTFVGLDPDGHFLRVFCPQEA